MGSPARDAQKGTRSGSNDQVRVLLVFSREREFREVLLYHPEVPKTKESLRYLKSALLSESEARVRHTWRTDLVLRTLSELLLDVSPFENGSVYGSCSAILVWYSTL